MRLLYVLLLLAVVYIMDVSSNYVEPVVVEVPGIFGKYGGYIVALVILVTSYLNNIDDNVRINVGGDTMTMNGNAPTPAG